MAEPQATLVLLSRNRPDRIAEALAGALAQEGDPIEVLISDDASAVATLEAMRRVTEGYSGPHTISVRRTPERVGYAAHLARAARAARGEFIVVAHDSDVPRPARVRSLLAAWQATGADLVASNAAESDAGGERRSLLPSSLPSRAVPLGEILAMPPDRTLAPGSFGAARAVFDLVRTLPPGAPAGMTGHVLDLAAAINGGVYYLSETLLDLGRDRPDEEATEAARRESATTMLLGAHALRHAVVGRWARKNPRLRELATAIRGRMLATAADWSRQRCDLLLDGLYESWSNPAH